eukprot:scaffold2388_cov201-Skeletonema_marinoi.AAC.5
MRVGNGGDGLRGCSLTYIQGVCCSPWGCGVVVSVVNRFTTRSDRRFTTIRETICKNEYRRHRPTLFASTYD